MENLESFFEIQDGSLWSYIEENKIRFNHTRFHEDNYFNSWVLLSGANNYKLMKLVYIYCFNESSITKQKKDV